MSQSEFLYVLNTVTKAYVSGDLDLLRSVTLLPLEMNTLSGAYTVTTEAELDEDFALYQRTIQTQSVTDIIRQLHTVAQVDPITLKGTYTTHIMSRAQRIVDPFKATMTVRYIDDTWRWTRLDNGVGHTNWFCR